MTADERLPTRRRALRMLVEQRSEIEALLARLAPRDRTRPGLGGGAWSPKDLVSHLALWERFALESVAAWERGEGSPVDRELWSKSTSRINAEEVGATADLSWARAKRRADRTHAEFVALVEGMSDRRWRSPATSRARKPLGARIGGYLAGAEGPFTHDLEHLRDLRAFVGEHARR
jgi:hypothetical protein